MWAASAFRRVRGNVFTKTCTDLSFCSSKLTGTSKAKTPEQKFADEKKAAKTKLTHIALIQPDKTVTHSTLEDAVKLTNRRDFKLIKISDFDKKRNSPVYQLLTAAQYREQTLHLKKSKETKKGPFKGEKLLAVNSKIGSHDLDSKVAKMLSWLSKSYEVRVTISGSNDESLAESVYKTIETTIGAQGRILQKRKSGTDIKFQVIPPKDSPESSPTKTQETKTE